MSGEDEAERAWEALMRRQQKRHLVKGVVEVAAILVAAGLAMLVVWVMTKGGAQ